MRFQRAFHFCSARLEYVDQIPVTAFEIVEHIAQLLYGSFGIEPKDPVNDTISPNLIGGVKASWFRCRFEGPDDDPCRVRTQI